MKKLKDFSGIYEKQKIYPTSQPLQRKKTTAKEQLYDPYEDKFKKDIKKIKMIKKLRRKIKFIDIMKVLLVAANIGICLFIVIQY